MPTYLVKSFEEDFSTKTLIGKEKKTFQTLEEIIETGRIKPNTKSFGQKRRLSTTILHRNYTKTYRPQGIIFQTNEKPNYVIPFDLVLLTVGDQIVVHYYRIKNILHQYYGQRLIPGYHQFIFRSIDAMLKKYPSPLAAWKSLNAFRIAHGHPPLPKSKFRLVEYNEAVFLNTISITPVAIFGYRAEAKVLAKQYHLPHYPSARSFFRRLHQ